MWDCVAIIFFADADTDADGAHEWCSEPGVWGEVAGYGVWSWVGGYGVGRGLRV